MIALSGCPRPRAKLMLSRGLLQGGPVIWSAGPKESRNGSDTKLAMGPSPVSATKKKTKKPKIIILFLSKHSKFARKMQKHNYLA
jgi:hypothetical protein